MKTIELNGLSAEEVDKVVVPGTVLLTYRGSIAHGMYSPTPDSIDDKDLMGVCFGEDRIYLGTGSFEQREVFHKEWDSVTYEIKKFVRLLIQSNPNVLSVLYTNPKFFLICEQEGQWLIDNRDLFVSKQAYKSFVGYAYSQLKRMTQYKGGTLTEIAYIAGIFDGEGHVSIHKVEGSKPTHSPVHWLDIGITNTDVALIDGLIHDYGGTVSRTGIRGGHRTDAFRWRLSSKAAGPFLKLILPFLKIKKRQAEIGLAFQHLVSNRPKGRPLTSDELDERDQYRQALKASRKDKSVAVPDSTVISELYRTGYLGEKRKALVEKFGYDTKAGAHLIRLLKMGIEYLNEGKLYVDRGEVGDATYLLGIKNGEWPLEKVKSEAESLFKRAEEAYDRCKLKPGPDVEAIEQGLVELMRKRLCGG